MVWAGCGHGGLGPRLGRGTAYSTADTMRGDSAKRLTVIVILLCIYISIIYIYIYVYIYNIYMYIYTYYNTNTALLFCMYVCKDSAAPAHARTRAHRPAAPHQSSGVSQTPHPTACPRAGIPHHFFFFFKAPKHTHPPQTPTRTALAHSTRTKSTDPVYIYPFLCIYIYIFIFLCCLI